MREITDSTEPVVEETSKPMKKPMMLTVVILSVALLSGIGTGVGLHKLNNKKTMSAESAAILEETPTSAIKVGDVYGSANEEIFKDSAEGVLQAGGLEGEGTHHLVRPGGISQTVYLTSTVADLDKFIGARIKVWGETNTAQKAGWLMDIGRIKVLELNAAMPEDSKPTEAPAKNVKATATPKAGAKKAVPADDGE